jgi:hypothetical protein
MVTSGEPHRWQGEPSARELAGPEMMIIDETGGLGTVRSDRCAQVMDGE